MTLEITKVFDYKDVGSGVEYKVSAIFQGVEHAEMYHKVPSDWPDQDAICIQFKEDNPSAERQDELEHLAAQVRYQRDQELSATDWWGVSDRTMTQAESEYRQALRDITSQAGFPQNVTWPTYPES